MEYIIGNRNGIIGSITIIEKDDKKQTVFCSFENNFFKKHPYDADLIMQDPKIDLFDYTMNNEEIVEKVLENNITNFSTIKQKMNFYWFQDDWTERRKELAKQIQEIIAKNY